jgi:hypothetical protein
MPVARPEIPTGSLLSLAPSTNGHNYARETTAVLDPVAIAAGAIQCVTALDRDRLTRTLRYIGETRFMGLVTHLFVIRALFPDALSTDDDATLREVRETLRETLDRLFIKLRLPNYVIAPRDLESAASRDALNALLDRLDAQSVPAELSGSFTLRGSIDSEELQQLRRRLDDAPIATALPWATLARFLPNQAEALRHYRNLLVHALDELAGADEVAFIDALQRKAYPILDAALDVVRAHLGNLSSV